MAAFLSHPLTRTEIALGSVYPARLGIQAQSAPRWLYQGQFQIDLSEPNGEEVAAAAALLSATVLEVVAAVAVYRRFDFYLSWSRSQHWNPWRRQTRGLFRLYPYVPDRNSYRSFYHRPSQAVEDFGYTPGTQKLPT